MRWSIVFFFTAVSVLVAGCAVSPEDEVRRVERESRIEHILNQHADVPELGGPEKCLAERDFRNFRALDDKRILFEGRDDKRWINTLRTRCPDLERGAMLRTRSFLTSRMCDGDTFEVLDWFDWPWYRRWPWRWGSAWGTGVTCSLGKFHPVTELQVDEIRGVLKSK